MFFKNKKKNTTIPKAEDMRSLSQKYPILKQKEIAVKIMREASRGRHHATFANSYILKDIAKGLKQNGYRVEVGENNNTNAPFVKVYW